MRVRRCTASAQWRDGRNGTRFFRLRKRVHPSIRRWRSTSERTPDEGTEWVEVEALTHLRDSFGHPALAGDQEAEAAVAGRVVGVQLQSAAEVRSRARPIPGEPPALQAADRIRRRGFARQVFQLEGESWSAQRDACDEALLRNVKVSGTSS